MQIQQLDIGTLKNRYDAGVPHPRADVNRVLGTFKVRYLDRDEGIPFTAHQQLIAGGRIGAIEGYATLREAMSELRSETKGEAVPAAVIMQRSGRFYGHWLKTRDMEEGFRAKPSAAHFEPDARVSVREFRTVDRNDRVRAIVDGEWDRRFRSSMA